MLFNPSKNVELTRTEIAIALKYKLEILKYIRSGNITTFSEAVGAFFDLFLSLIDITEKELILEAFSLFATPEDSTETTFQNFIDSYNSSFERNISGGNIDEVIAEIEENDDDLATKTGNPNFKGHRLCDRQRNCKYGRRW